MPHPIPVQLEAERTEVFPGWVRDMPGATQGVLNGRQTLLRRCQVPEQC